MQIEKQSPRFLRGVLAGMRVLLVEDAPDNRFLLTRFLRMAGVEVDIAENGMQALELADACIHDLILMDIQMPLLDGCDAAALLKARGFRRPIIALSACGNMASGELPFDAYLAKPISQAALVDALLPWYKRHDSGTEPLT